jgi:Putative zinc-finger
MTGHREAPDLATYALGGLSDTETAEVDEHLTDCAACQDELAELRKVADRLGEIPPEFFLEGPPDGGDLLVQRAVSRVRAERRGAVTRRRVLTAAVAAVAAVLLIGAGAVAGRQSAPAPTASGATSTPVPGTRTASATDPRTGAGLSVDVVPAAGWVRLSARVTGIPSGQRCRLVVVGAAGQRETAGSWLVSAQGARSGSSLSGFALVDPAQVSAVVVENFAGRQFVSAPVT